jgi:hypothetical protein
MENPIHLGDGAYATNNDWEILLTANHHDPRRASDTVCLDMNAAKNLHRWLGEALKDK